MDCACRYAMGAAVAAVEQTVVNMALGLADMLGKGGVELSAISTRLSAWPAPCTAIASLGCATLLKAFAAVAAHPLVAQVPLAVFSTAQQQAREILLDTAARLKAIAQHAPTGEAAVTVRSQLGFASSSALHSGRASSISGTPPFPVREPSQGDAAASTHTHQASASARSAPAHTSDLPESYSCPPDVSALDPSPIIHIVFSRSLEVRTLP